jgi:hypothetical protein
MRKMRLGIGATIGVVPKRCATNKGEMRNKVKKFFSLTNKDFGQNESRDAQQRAQR